MERKLNRRSATIIIKLLNYKIQIKNGAHGQTVIFLKKKQHSIKEYTQLLGRSYYGIITKAMLSAFLNGKKHIFCIISPSHTAKAQILPLSGIPVCFNYLLCRYIWKLERDLSCLNSLISLHIAAWQWTKGNPKCRCFLTVT